MSPILMDLVSKNLLQNYWYLNFNHDGNFVNLRITPDSTNNMYPATFLVTATGSYANDEYVYNFSY